MTDHLREHRELLAKASAGGLPETVNKTSPVSLSVLAELVEAGHISAVDAQSFDGPCFVTPRITVSGREYLNVLDERHEASSLKGRAKKFGLLFAGWVAGIISALAVLWLGKFL